MRDIQKQIVEIAYSQIARTGKGTTDEVKQRAIEIMQSMIDTGLDDVLLEVHSKRVEWAKKTEEWLNSKAPCKECEEVYTCRQLKEWEDFYKSIIDSDTIKFYGEKDDIFDLRGSHIRSRIRDTCNKCAEKIYISYVRECDICGNKYHANRPDDKTNICQNCHNPIYMEEAKRVYQHIARAESLGRQATLTFKQWIGTLHTFGWKCAYCPDDFECIEHFLPISLKGGTSVDNCLPSCGSCNARKNDRHPDDLDRIFPAANLQRIRDYLASVTVAQPA